MLERVREWQANHMLSCTSRLELSFTNIWEMHTIGVESEFGSQIDVKAWMA